MKFTTQKAQITSSKKNCDQHGGIVFDQVIISLAKNKISVSTTKDILQLAGSMKNIKKKSAEEARNFFEEEYHRF